MHSFKQGITTAILVVVLGLFVPGLFGGPVAADISRPWGVQPMEIKCNLDGKSSTGINGYEYVSEVTSADKEFHNHHSVGFQVFRWGTLQDINNSLVFSVQTANASEILTAVENKGGDTQTTADDTSPGAKVVLSPGDPRLSGGYPVSFAIPPDHPYSYFAEGGISLGNKTNKKNLVDCEFTDLGKANVDIDGDGKVEEEEACYVEGVLQDVCYQNAFEAGLSDNSSAVPCDRTDGGDRNLCFAAGVAYHYTDIITGKFHVSKNSDAVSKAQTKHKNNKHDRKGGHKGKKRGR